MMRPFAVTAGGTMASRQGASQQETVSREGVPTRFALHQNYPNPFNPATSIRFEVPQDVRVTLKVFNGAGQEVATLADQVYAAGIHTVHFNARQLASGVYYTKMTAGSFTAMGKMILVK